MATLRMFLTITLFLALGVLAACTPKENAAKESTDARNASAESDQRANGLNDTSNLTPSDSVEKIQNTPEEKNSTQPEPSEQSSLKSPATYTEDRPNSKNPPPGAPWTRDFLQAHREASEAGKPIFIYSTKTR